MNQLTLKKARKKNKTGYAATLIIMVIFILFIINPEKYSRSVTDGIMLFAANLLPSLLTFFFFTKILTSMGNIEAMTRFAKKPLEKIFRLPRQFGYILFISILSGYPIGAKLTAELCACDTDRGRVTRLAAASSTSGIIFVGGAAATMLGYSEAALLLYVSHISSVLLFSLVSGLFVKYNVNYAQNLKNDNFGDNALSESVYSSVISILGVGALIAVFFMLIDMLSALPYIENIFCAATARLGLPQDLAKGVASGIMEMTRGCQAVSGCAAGIKIKLCAAAFIITFGGGCVFLQTFAFLAGKIKYPLFILYKFIQALLAGFICWILCSALGV
jgi:sporulation integral membrane protein YlbJ